MNKIEERRFWRSMGYNNNSQGVSQMQRIEKYIDNCLIDEYADKSNYTLDVSDLPQNELDNFLDQLMSADTEVRDLVLYKMQQLIDSRLPEVELKDRQDKGIKTFKDRTTGEVRFYL